MAKTEELGRQAGVCDAARHRAPPDLAPESPCHPAGHNATFPHLLDIRPPLLSCLQPSAAQIPLVGWPSADCCSPGSLLAAAMSQTKDCDGLEELLRSWQAEPGDGATRCSERIRRPCRAPPLQPLTSQSHWCAGLRLGPSVQDAAQRPRPPPLPSQIFSPICASPMICSRRHTAPLLAAAAAAAAAALQQLREWRHTADSAGTAAAHACWARTCAWLTAVPPTWRHCLITCGATIFAG